jgi:iron(III) transport system substrate-binding protein
MSQPTAPAAVTLLALLAACGGDGREVLTVYSPHGREMLEAFERRFEDAHPGVDLQWMDMGSQEIYERIRSERANPQADVWWGAPSTLFARAEAEGLLEVVEVSWAGSLPPEARGRGGAWFGHYLTPEVIAYNTDAVSAAEAPRDWDDVLDPRWRGRVVIRDPMASGTMRTIFGMVMDRSIRATGDTAQGVAWLRRLDAQTREYVLNPTLLYQKLARQEGVITLWAMPDIEMIRERYGYPVDYVLPSSGTPLLVDGVAVVRGTRNPALALRFLEWVGSEPELLVAAREHHRLPARADFPADSLPPRLRSASERLVAEPLDWERLEREGAGWMRYWDDHVRGGRR